MTERMYLSILKNEQEILTALDVARILRIGKNKAYALIKSGKINSIKIGGKIIVPKMCLINYLMDTKSYQISIKTVSNNSWNSPKICDMVDIQTY